MYSLPLESIERYEILNEELQEEGIDGLEFIVIGGEAGKAILGEDEFRKTIDIDFYAEYLPSPLALTILEDLGFEVVGVLEAPPPEEMTHAYTHKLSNITLHYPSVEYFALSKLMTQRGKDEEDLKEYPILDKCDLNFLRDKIEEYKVELLNPSNFNYNFHNFEEYLKYRKLK